VFGFLNDFWTVDFHGTDTLKVTKLPPFVFVTSGKKTAGLLVETRVFGEALDAQGTACVCAHI
jgi:hypothetical protein